MKTNGTRILIIAIILYICLVIFSFTSFAVPDYNFSSGSLISGTDKTVGARYRFTNVKPGEVDTLAKQCMFTVVNTATSTVTIRVVAQNNSTGTKNRLRSVYFQRFRFVNSFLAKPALMNFHGPERNMKVDLQWELSLDHHLNTIEIETSSNGSQFRKIAAMSVNDITQRNFNYTDNNPIEGTHFID